MTSRETTMPQAGETITIPRRVYETLTAAFAAHEAEWLTRQIRDEPQHRQIMHLGDPFGRVFAWIWNDDPDRAMFFLAEYLAALRDHNPVADLSPPVRLDEVLRGLAWPCRTASAATTRSSQGTPRGPGLLRRRPEHLTPGPSCQTASRISRRRLPPEPRCQESRQPCSSRLSRLRACCTPARSDGIRGAGAGDAPEPVKFVAVGIGWRRRARRGRAGRRAVRRVRGQLRA